MRKVALLINVMMTLALTLAIPSSTLSTRLFHPPSSRNPPFVPLPTRMVQAWSVPIGSYVPDVVTDGDQVAFVAENGTSVQLRDLHTGRLIRTLLPFSDRPVVQLAVARHTLIEFVGAYENKFPSLLMAYDMPTGRLQWMRALQEQPKTVISAGISLVASPAGLVLADNDGAFGISLTTGKQTWKIQWPDDCRSRLNSVDRASDFAIATMECRPGNFRLISVSNTTGDVPWTYKFTLPASELPGRCSPVCISSAGWITTGNYGDDYIDVYTPYGRRITRRGPFKDGLVSVQLSGTQGGIILSYTLNLKGPYQYITEAIDPATGSRRWHSNGGWPNSSDASNPGLLYGTGDGGGINFYPSFITATRPADGARATLDLPVPARTFELRATSSDVVIGTEPSPVGPELVVYRADQGPHSTVDTRTWPNPCDITKTTDLPGGGHSYAMLQKPWTQYDKNTQIPAECNFLPSEPAFPTLSVSVVWMTDTPASAAALVQRDAQTKLGEIFFQAPNSTGANQTVYYIAPWIVANGGRVIFTITPQEAIDDPQKIQLWRTEAAQMAEKIAARLARQYA